MHGFGVENGQSAKARRELVREHTVASVDDAFGFRFASPVSYDRFAACGLVARRVTGEGGDRRRLVWA